MWELDVYNWKQLLGSSDSVFTVCVRFTANSSQENPNIQGKKCKMNNLERLFTSISERKTCDYMYLKSSLPTFYWE